VLALIVSPLSAADKTQAYKAAMKTRMNVDSYVNMQKWKKLKADFDAGNMLAVSVFHTTAMNADVLLRNFNQEEYVLKPMEFKFDTTEVDTVNGKEKIPTLTFMGKTIAGEISKEKDPAPNYNHLWHHWNKGEIDKEYYLVFNISHEMRVIAKQSGMRIVGKMEKRYDYEGYFELPLKFTSELAEKYETLKSNFSKGKQVALSGKYTVSDRIYEANNTCEKIGDAMSVIVAGESATWSFVDQSGNERNLTAFYYPPTGIIAGNGQKEMYMMDVTEYAGELIARISMTDISTSNPKLREEYGILTKIK
jgi:hypothetical protein